MILTTPILTKINTFDPSLDTNISFSYSGGQIQKKRLIIKNSSTLEVVYDDIQLGMQLSYSLTANTLTPGQYVTQIQVFDFNGNSSELSESVLFYCYSTPVLEFNNLSSILNNANITLEVTYSQAQGDTLSEFVYYLYDNNKILLSQSSSIYTISSYTFYGLKDQQTYYVRCAGVTTSGMSADTGYVEINIQYVTQPNNMVFQLTNHRCEGYISVDCNIIDVGYEVGGDGEYTIADGEVALSDNTYVSYDSGFDLSNEFSVFVKVRKLPLNKDFFSMNSDNDYVSLSVVCVGGDYYCKLTAKSALENYYRYAILPTAMTVDENINYIIDENENIIMDVIVDYENNYITVFEVKRKNNLYSLKVYYEDNGIIITDENE